MVISFPFDIFTWKHLIGGISNPESLDRYVLMICDLRSLSSVYCCNRREVIPVWPLWLCWRDTSCPYQASEAAHRSVKLSFTLWYFLCRKGLSSKLGNKAHYSPESISVHCLFLLFSIYKLVCLGSMSSAFIYGYK